jgi:hypothetical protein
VAPRTCQIAKPGRRRKIRVQRMYCGNTTFTVNAASGKCAQVAPCLHGQLPIHRSPLALLVRVPGVGGVRAVCLLITRLISPVCEGRRPLSAPAPEQPLSGTVRTTRHVGQMGEGGLSPFGEY